MKSISGKSYAMIILVLHTPSKTEYKNATTLACNQPKFGVMDITRPMAKTSKSQQLFNDAQQVIPGGVNSPVRAFTSVGGNPKFIAKAKGAYLYDVDGNAYIDYVGAWGVMVLGHADPQVINAVKAQAEFGLSYGAPCQLEIELAQKICKLIPSIEQIRFVNSGTESTMSAVRLARAYTEREKIIKFSGCYHGHSDQFLVQAGSGALTLGVPSSPGVPKDTTQHTLTALFNDIDSVRSLFQAYQHDIACVIIEPIAGNMNFIAPTADFLQNLQQLCREHGALLIFDEVMTGFRVSLTGAQGLYGITPDLTTFGKIIGGGMPIGAFGGRKKIMQMLSPAGDVYQAGTLSGNPMAMQAGLVTLEKILAPGFYQALENKLNYLVNGLNSIANTHDFPFFAKGIGGMFGLFFTGADTIDSFDDLKQFNRVLFNQFFHFMLNNGVYFAPSPYEAGFISIAHNDREIQTTLDLFEQFICNR